MKHYTPRHKTRKNPATDAVAVVDVVDTDEPIDALPEAFAFFETEAFISNIELFGYDPNDAYTDMLTLAEDQPASLTDEAIDRLSAALINSMFPNNKVEPSDAYELLGQLGEAQLSATNEILSFAQLLGITADYAFENIIKEPLQLLLETTEIPDEVDVEAGTLAEVYAGPEGRVFVSSDYDNPTFELTVIAGSEGPILGVKAEDFAFALFDNNDAALVDVVFPISFGKTDAFAIVLPELYDYASSNGETVRSDFYGQLIDLNAYVSLLLELEAEPYIQQGSNVDYLLREGLVAATRRIYNHYMGKDLMGPPDQASIAVFQEAYPDKIALAAKITDVLHLFNLVEFPRYGHEQLVELYVLAAVGPLGLLGDGAAIEVNSLYSDAAGTFKARLCAPAVKPTTEALIESIYPMLAFDNKIRQGFAGLCALDQNTLYQRLMQPDGFEKSITGGAVQDLFEFRGAAYRKGLEQSGVIDVGGSDIPETAEIGAPAVDNVFGDVAGKGVRPTAEVSSASKVVGGLSVAGAVVGLYALVRHAQGKPVWSFN